LITLFINMSEQPNILDKVTDDSTKIVITSKSVKWIIGILSGAVGGILMFAWGLYVTVNSKVDAQYENINTVMEKNKTEIIDKMTELDKEKIEKNKEKNNVQDVDIGRLYERTDSQNNRINNNVSRPETLSNEETAGPSF